MPDTETPPDTEARLRAEAQQYVDDMVSARGYVLRYHQILAASDYEVLKAANGLISAAYLAERGLSRATKELIFIVSLIVLGAPKEHVQSHIRVALNSGVTPGEILEAIEITLPEAGVVAFQRGVEYWHEIVGGPIVEPTVSVGE
jgi:4-carboxymuconolactone decarboxylase